MSVALRIILIVGCLVTFIYAMRKIKKSQMKIEDTFFWIFLSIALVIISIFPGIAEYFASLIGIISATNFVFLIIIFLLLAKVFFLSLQISQLDEKVKNLVQKLAIINNETEEKISSLDKDKDDK